MVATRKSYQLFAWRQPSRREIPKTFLQYSQKGLKTQCNKNQQSSTVLISVTTRWAPFDKTQKRLTGKGVKHSCLYWHHLNQEQALTSNGLEEFTCCVPLPASPSRCCHVQICTRKNPDAHSRTRGREGKGHTCVEALDEIKIWWSMKRGLMESQRTSCFLVNSQKIPFPV